jgi:hypothetical protein
LVEFLDPYGIGDPHAIKYAEPCERESTLNARPEYLASAAKVIGPLLRRSFKNKLTLL